MIILHCKYQQKNIDLTEISTPSLQIPSVRCTSWGIKVAPYSFLKSGKHMFQTQNLVHWYFVRKIKLNVWYRTAFWESQTVTKKCVTVGKMAANLRLN